ncbi:hypothetical protein BHM03_00014589 [Ensete ventricosum]|nr:hypothetical protein BHM03_00014589 [Ensete ventricosum]
MSREGHYHTKRLREPDKSKDKVEQANVATKEAKKNRIDVSPRGSATQKQSVDQKRGGLGGVPQCRRGGPTDHKERDADARQRIVGPWIGNAMIPQRRDFRGVIDPLLSWRESVGRKRD